MFAKIMEIAELKRVLNKFQIKSNSLKGNSAGPAVLTVVFLVE